MGKYAVLQYADYVSGHLRTGYKEVIVEAESEDEALHLVEAGELLTDAPIVVDDYEIHDYEMDPEVHISEIKKGE